MDLIRVDVGVRAVIGIIAEGGNTICVAALLAAKDLDSRGTPLPAAMSQQDRVATVVSKMGDSHKQSPGTGDAVAERRWMEDWSAVRRWLMAQARGGEASKAELEEIVTKSRRVAAKCAEEDGQGANRLNAAIAAEAIGHGDATSDGIMLDFFEGLTPGPVASKTTKKTPAEV